MARAGPFDLTLAGQILTAAFTDDGDVPLQWCKRAIVPVVRGCGA